MSEKNWNVSCYVKPDNEIVYTACLQGQQVAVDPEEKAKCAWVLPGYTEWEAKKLQKSLSEMPEQVKKDMLIKVPKGPMEIGGKKK